MLKEAAASVDVETLHPFGNDRFLQQNIQNSLLGSRCIYWDPEAIINWRQRRNAIRRKERAEERMETEAAAAPQPAAVITSDETPQVKAPLSEIAENKTAVREITSETRKKA